MGYFNFKNTNEKDKGTGYLFNFLEGTGTDDYGRKIEDIWKLSFDEKEYLHNYIQRIFPTDEMSKFDADAEIITKREAAVLAKNKMIIANMKKSYDVMLDFYGLKQYEKHKLENWLVKYNHNHLRLTRILKSLRLFGLNKEAKELYKKLLGIAKAKVDPIALRNWEEAMKGRN